MSTWSDRRIREICAITGARSYLEIGVNKGETFNVVNMPEKDAVDPKFLFDTASYANDTVRFFEITSDEFFTSPHGKPAYDLFFLDGLHTFEQTLRDFLSALTRSHHRTVYLIDDTVPSDVYSSLNDLQAAYSFRAKAVGQAMHYDWHGDVYKTVLALHDFFPTLDFATITDGGNPQTLVWHERRRNFAPMLNDLEKISRATYFDVPRYQDAFHFMSEQDAFQRLREASAGWRQS
jgi:hypothetical protein